MNKVYFKDVNTEYDAREFIDWLLDLSTPCEVVLNGGISYKFKEDMDKLYFLTAFEAVLNIDPC